MSISFLNKNQTTMNDNIISPVSNENDRIALAKAKDFIAKNKKRVHSWYDPKLQAYITTTRLDHMYPINGIMKKIGM